MVAAARPWWDSKIMTRRAATRWRPCSRPSRSQGQPAGQVGLAYTLGDAYFGRPRRVGGAVEGFSDPRGYFISPLDPITCRTSGHALSGSLLATAAGRGGAADPWQARQAAVAALLAGAPATTIASSATARSRGSARPALRATPPARKSCRLVRRR